MFFTVATMFTERGFREECRPDAPVPGLPARTVWSHPFPEKDVGTHPALISLRAASSQRGCEAAGAFAPLHACPLHLQTGGRLRTRLTTGRDLAGPRLLRGCELGSELKRPGSCSCFAQRLSSPAAPSRSEISPLPPGKIRANRSVINRRSGGQDA